ncbi:hypothetical protein BurJ1DRAFT_2817 [Burkholderiales bacterium JOSHI_001]|nr:hypothetical protein BurJ1DRAFT_2817 [Burkholderiales bacterium JOSHI_001]
MFVHSQVMRHMLVFMLAGLCWQACALAQEQGIVQVLVHSQQMRLQQCAVADPQSPASQRLRTSFERLQRLLPAAQDVRLDILQGELFAEAMLGERAVVASEAVGELPEGERLMLLAHELGHLALGHAQALGALYLRFIPGAVKPETTDPVARELAESAHALSHQQEFEADAYGFTQLRALGFGLDSAWSMLTRQGVNFDSATHPGTRRRIAQLRSLDSRLNQPGLAVAPAAALAGR